MGRIPVILAALFLLAPVLARAGAGHSRVVRYDTSLQLQLDGSVISTRTLLVSFPSSHNLYQVFFYNTSSSDGYTYRYRYELLSAEADYGSGFERVPAKVTDQSEWRCILGDSREFPSLTRFRLKIRSWGATFIRGAGVGFRFVAVPPRPVDGTVADVDVEVPAEAADGAHYNFVVGPLNSLDGVMVSAATPRATAPGEFQAAMAGPNHATFKVLRPLRQGELVSVGVYMPSSAVRPTTSFTRTKSTWLNAPGVIGVAVAIILSVIFFATAGLILLVIASRKAVKRRT